MHQAEYHSVCPDLTKYTGDDETNHRTPECQPLSRSLGAQCLSHGVHFNRQVWREFVDPSRNDRPNRLHILRHVEEGSVSNWCNLSPIGAKLADTPVGPALMGVLKTVCKILDTTCPLDLTADKTLAPDP